MQVKIFIPQTDKEYIESIAKSLTRKFGGCTVYQNLKGYWLNESTNTIEVDDITVIEIFTKKTESMIRRILSPYLKQIKFYLKQNCVAYSINNRMLFY
jgi:hypothetical protein